MKKTSFLETFWQALGSPLAFAWGLLLAVVAGVYLWCSVSYNAHEHDRTTSVFVDLPHLDETPAQVHALGQGLTPKPSSPASSLSENDEIATIQVLAQPRSSQTAGDAATPATRESSSLFSPSSSESVASPEPKDASGATSPVPASKGTQAHDTSQHENYDQHTPAASSEEPRDASVDELLSEHPVDSKTLPYWRRFASPAGRARRQDTGPSLGLIVLGLGLDTELTQKAIDKLPPEVTLAFSPYTKDLAAWIQKARDHGHEILLALPVEPDNFAQMDPGPLTLLAESNAAANQKRLGQVLDACTGCVGVISSMSHCISKAESVVAVMFNGLAQPGLIMVNALHPSMPTVLDQARKSKVPFVSCDIAIDHESSGLGIEASFSLLEGLARERTSALATITIYPHTLDKLLTWLSTMPRKNIHMTMVTQLVKP